MSERMPEIPFEAHFDADSAVMGLQGCIPKASDADKVGVALQAAAPHIRAQALREVADYCTRRANQMDRIRSKMLEQRNKQGAEQAKAAEMAYGQVLIELELLGVVKDHAA